MSCPERLGQDVGALLMGNDGAEGGCPESLGGTLEGVFKSQRWLRFSPYPLGLWDPLLPHPRANPGSPLILSLSKSRGWTGQFFKTLPARELDYKCVNLAKGAGCLDPLLQGRGRAERVGME